MKNNCKMRTAKSERKSGNRTQTECEHDWTDCSQNKVIHKCKVEVSSFNRKHPDQTSSIVADRHFLIMVSSEIMVFFKRYAE